MKKILVFTLLASPLSVYSAGLNLNSQDFGKINLAENAVELPSPVMQRSDAVQADAPEMTELYLLAQTGKNSIFTYAKTEAQFQEFKNMWLPILENNGLKTTGVEYKNEFGIINYESKDGLVIRDFWADRLHYDALNKSEMAKLKEDLSNALNSNGMKTVASFYVKNDVVRPTFKLYYLTRQAESQEKEVQLRQLMKGEDIDFNLLEKSVQIVKKDASFSMAYIGREVGFVSKLAKDPESAEKKVEEYKKFLTDNKKEFIAYKVIKLDEPFVSLDLVFTHLVNIYFFQ